MRLDLFGKATFLFCLFSVASSTSAVDRFWIDTGGGPFELTSNWSATSGGSSGASVPTVGDFTIFDLNQTYTVTFAVPGPAESDELRVTMGDVTFGSENPGPSGTYNIGGDAGINGGNLTLGTLGSPVTLDVGDDLVVRHSASASSSLLNILFGSNVLVTDTVSIGANSAATGDGMVTVSGSRSLLDAPTGLVNLGGFGNTGILNVRARASANLATTSDMLGIGNSGFDTTVGTLLINGGSTVNAGNIEIATLTSLATGSITVDGTNSALEQTLSGATLTVGSSSGGTGVINVTNGGTFTTGTGAATIDATGTLNIHGGDFNARGGLDNSAGGPSIFATVR